MRARIRQRGGWTTAFVILTASLAIAGCGAGGGGGDGGLDADGGGGDGGDGKATFNKPAGYASVTFYVDDTSNQTYTSADIEWKGSFVYDPQTNIIVHDASWAGEVGPYPPLYDDGPIAEGGHEMPGAGGGDHIFSVEVYVLADESFNTDFQYGAINEFDNWIWEGSNGEFSLPAGSNERIDATGYVIPAFGTYDMRVTLDTAGLNNAFLPFDPAGDRVYLKGSMNSWDARQLLDNGEKGDSTAGDGIYTYHHAENLGPHDGMLFAGQHVQFVFMLNGLEYKRIDALADGVTASTNCTGPDVWDQAPIVMEPESRGRIKNTTLVICEGGGGVSVGSVVPASGDPAGGQVVSVYGSGFEDGALVKFGGELAGDIQFVGSGQLNCSTPAHAAGAVGVRVTNPGGDFAELADGFVYQAGDQPEILFLQPRKGGVGGGTPVTITGRRFASGLTVDFGGAAATNIVLASDSRLSCVTPAHTAGKVSVSVTNPGGAAASFPDGYEYIDSSGPLISGIDPAMGSVAGGDDVTIYGSGFDAGATVTFDGIAATEIVSNPPGSIACKTPSHTAGSVDVVVTNSDQQADALAGGFSYEVPRVDWAALQWPLSMVLDENQASELVYAQVYEPGVTDMPGCGLGITAQLGYGPQGVSPQDDPGAFSWGDAACNDQCDTCGNNDEYQAAFIIPQAGQYDYAYRFSMDQGGSWVVAEGIGTATVRGGGVDLEVWEAQPAVGSVLGGQTITVAGSAFVDGAVVSLDGEALVTTFVDAGSLTATTLPHAPGMVELVVTNPDSAYAALTQGFDFVLRGTPDLERNTSGQTEIETTSGNDWDSAFLAGSNAVGSDWGDNHADELYVAFDDGNLYLGIRGWVDFQAGNAIVAYIDTDFGPGSGIANMNDLSDDFGIDGAPGFDAAVSSIAAVSVQGFGAELAAGTLGMAEIEAGDEDPAHWVLAGARGFSDPADFGWLPGVTLRTSQDNQAIEMAIPVSVLLGGPIPQDGAHLALFVRLVNHHGEYLSNDTLPLDDPSAPEDVGQVFVFEMR
ncbi:MAG TPA: IPT/TIG domain-containing protein [Myxococcota bacterium]|nr:IPT/TIG domain-containing protein [Myxococcota bacterium]